MLTARPLQVPKEPGERPGFGEALQLQSDDDRSRGLAMSRFSGGSLAWSDLGLVIAVFLEDLDGLRDDLRRKALGFVRGTQLAGYDAALVYECDCEGGGEACRCEQARVVFFGIVGRMNVRGDIWGYGWGSQPGLHGRVAYVAMGHLRVAQSNYANMAPLPGFDPLR